MGTYRSKTKPWYGTARWKARRATQLAIEPLCRMCKKAGRIVQACVADHIEPHKGSEYAFWHNELQSLCKHCHDSAKARQENGKTVHTYGTDGWPIA